MMELPYPGNLVDEILYHACPSYQGPGESELIAIDPADLTDDQLAGLKYAISTLTEQQQESLKHKYEHDLNYTETAKIMELSDSYIRELTVKAIRRLSHPSLRVYIWYGLEYTQKQMAEQERERKEAAERKQMEQVALDRLTALSYSPVDSLPISTKAKNFLAKSEIKIMDDAYKFVSSTLSSRIAERMPATTEEIVKAVIEYKRRAIKSRPQLTKISEGFRCSQCLGVIEIKKRPNFTYCPYCGQKFVTAKESEELAEELKESE